MSAAANSRRLITSVAAALLVLLCGAPAAGALFTAGETAGPATVATASLGAPTGLTAKQAACTSGSAVDVELAWKAPAGSIKPAYSVERSTSSTGRYVQVGTTASGTVTFKDSTGLAGSTTYYYRVSSVYQSWGTASAVVSVKTKACGG